MKVSLLAFVPVLVLAQSAFQDDAAAIRQLTQDVEMESLKNATRDNAKAIADLAADTATRDSTMWLMLCGILVMIMQAGFAMLEAGCARDKFVQSILLKNMIDVCVGTLGWYFLGWAFAYGDPINWADEIGYTGEGCDMNVNATTGVPFTGDDLSYYKWGCFKIGSSNMALWDVYTEAEDGSITNTGDSTALNWFFQWAFCQTASTIVSGGVMERVNFFAYLIFVLFMDILVTPTVMAQTWNYGWFESAFLSMWMDFAGSGVVHLCGGIGALAGTLVLGPRIGKFGYGIKYGGKAGEDNGDYVNEDKKRFGFHPQMPKDKCMVVNAVSEGSDKAWDEDEEFAPHNMTFVVLGTMILWFGWYGFNCGSTLAMDSAGTAALAQIVACNTTICAASCATTVFFICMATKTKLYDPEKTGANSTMIFDTCFGQPCCVSGDFKEKKADTKYRSHVVLDVGHLCNGVLAGLVSITAPCGNVHPWSAFWIGIIGAFVYYGAAFGLAKAGIDDPLNAFPVHGACGIWGLFAAALFDWGSKFHGWNGFGAWADADAYPEAKGVGSPFVANLLMALFIIAWSGGITGAVFATLHFFPIHALGLPSFMRISPEVENMGLDRTELSFTYAYTHQPHRGESNMKSPKSKNADTKSGMQMDHCTWTEGF